MKSGRCKFCESDALLVKAHIYPKSVYDYIRRGDKYPSKLYSSDSRIHPKRTQIGVYDQTILCQTCEDGFKKYDDYGAALLLKDVDPATLIPNANTPVAYSVAKYDYTRLKLFFLGVLWRASASRHEVFQKCDLGPHEHAVRAMIRDGDPGGPEDFGVALRRYIDDLGQYSTTSPYRTKICGVNFTVLHMAGYKAFIKTDRRLLPVEFAPCVLAPGRPLYVLTHDIRLDKDFAFMRKVVMSRTHRK
ncbi:hypothetical protein J8C06_13735 [Chloracidobacterium validum]|uniref:HNH endonuclease 5 domain-containing protein n=1 Tax=Chloracidobacterium validum TaxID=2821543 RepID=A0ABX8BEQ8_9BACT|nr:hypothetical protein [Chloracidobacterium validum]QUW04108.1 hypothetical protein J8C06_13735 [Chloracidobacterium validum]